MSAKARSLVTHPARASVAPTEVVPDLGEIGLSHEILKTDEPWLVMVWNDPIKLITYVTFVFQKLFGYSKEVATNLMLDVHNRGRAVVSSGTRDHAENDVTRLHAYGLWATMEQAG